MVIGQEHGLGAVFDEVGQVFQQDSCYTRKQADRKAQDQDQPPLLDAADVLKQIMLYVTVSVHHWIRGANVC
jgi:hypothetical protein